MKATLLTTAVLAAVFTFADSASAQRGYGWAGYGYGPSPFGGYNRYGYGYSGSGFGYGLGFSWGNGYYPYGGPAFRYNYFGDYGPVYPRYDYGYYPRGGYYAPGYDYAGGAPGYSNTEAPLAPDRARLQIILPQADAQLSFNGRPESMRGRVRVFELSLEPGWKYWYKVEATWSQDGRPVLDSRHVDLVPGKVNVVDFTKPAVESGPQDEKRP